jgi:hypothetical protein
MALSVAAQDAGPLQIRNHRSLSLPFLRLLPEFGVPARGDRLWSVSWVVANDIKDYSDPSAPPMREDQETLRVALRYEEGLGKARAWWVEVPFVARGGGFLDPIIDWWHAHVLGWSDPLRNNTPFGRSTVEIPGAGVFGSAGGLGDISGGMDISLGGGWQASCAVKLPTGAAEKLIGSGAPDGALGVSGMHRLGAKWWWYVQGALVLQGKATRLPRSRDLVHQEALAFIYVPNSKDRWVAQWQGEASATCTGQPGSDATHRVVSIGYRRKIAADQTLEAFFTEDRDVLPGMPILVSVGPDFTIGMIWRRRL